MTTFTAPWLGHQACTTNCEPRDITSFYTTSWPSTYSPTLCAPSNTRYGSGACLCFTLDTMLLGDQYSMWVLFTA